MTYRDPSHNDCIVSVKATVNSDIFWKLKLDPSWTSEVLKDDWRFRCIQSASLPSRKEQDTPSSHPYFAKLSGWVEGLNLDLRVGSKCMWTMEKRENGVRRLSQTEQTPGPAHTLEDKPEAVTTSHYQNQTTCGCGDQGQPAWSCTAQQRARLEHRTQRGVSAPDNFSARSPRRLGQGPQSRRELAVLKGEAEAPCVWLVRVQGATFRFRRWKGA